MKTKKRIKIKTTTKIIFILTVILFFGLCFNLLDFDFGDEASAVISSNKWQMDTNLSQSDASFLGEMEHDWSGSSVSRAGDVNGDGYDDFLIGARLQDEGSYNAGQTYLILGKAYGWQMDINLSNADASFIGEDRGDYSGSSVSSAGDVNNDGFDDFLISACGNDEGGSSAGQTYLILGKAYGWQMDTNLSNADASFIGENRGDRSGYDNDISSAGDVNNDGFDDFLIGAYHNDEGGFSAGQTYLILGKAYGWQMDINLSNADASFIGEDRGDWSGSSVSSAGDVNNDGYDDFLIGARLQDEGSNNAGQTYLILGKASGWQMDTNLSNADASFIGEDVSDCSGDFVSIAGDVNNDGYDDFLITAVYNGEGEFGAGQTYLILGKASGWQMDNNLSNADASFVGEMESDKSASGIASADVNNDGYDDFLLGVSSNDEGSDNAGQTYLILGKASGWQIDTNLSNSDASFIGEASENYSGGFVSSAGDVNNDGYDDFLISACGNDEGGFSAGQTYLILGGEGNRCAFENESCSSISCCSSPPAPEPLTCVDNICRTCISKLCTANQAKDHSISEMGDSIDDIYCTWNIHDGCLVKEGVETIDGSTNPSYWEGEDCFDSGSSDLWGEKKVYIDDINDYNIIVAKVCVDDYNFFWINGVRVNVLELGDPDFSGGQVGCARGYDVRSFFQTGWNTIKFKAVDTCSGNRLIDIGWRITPRALALNGNAISYSEISLSWSDRGSGVTYSLWNFDTSSYVYVGDQTSFKHTGLDANTTYSYKITATKSGYTSNWSNSISATTFNDPPTADAGLDQFVVIGNSVNLDGSGSYDPDGDPIVYHWTFNSIPGTSFLTDADFSNKRIVNPSFTPDVIGVYRIELKVTDVPYGGFDTDTVSITVANPPPVCGNNLVEGSEECDGTDKDACGEQYCIPAGEPGECTCQKPMPAWKEVHPGD